MLGLMASEWAPGDSWFLAAVALAQSRGLHDLSSVIEMADFVNHSILNLDEIEQAVGRLRSAGLLLDADDSFALSEEGLALWERAPDPQPLRRLMWLPSGLRSYEFDPTSTWALDPQIYRAALDSYRQRFAEALERLDRRHHRDREG